MEKFEDYDRINESSHYKDIKPDSIMVERYDDDVEGYFYKLKIEADGKTFYAKLRGDDYDDGPG